MTKQEKIREGMDKIFSKYGKPDIDSVVFPLIKQEILSYLHSQGVVIKVDRELPFPNEEMNQRLVSPVPLMSPFHGSVIEAYRLAQQDMGEADWEAVEPLIREKNNE